MVHAYGYINPFCNTISRVVPLTVSLEDWWSEDRDWQLTGDVEDSMLDDEEDDSK